jgi:hypothetical protein
LTRADARRQRPLARRRVFKRDFSVVFTCLKMLVDLPLGIRYHFCV